ncbi:hypothetical protein C2857_003902 [Epichloe festucae Fl1]|uniref:Uncharacterized protein n=1 Tax=Epichloe festucae (strain Fl1) TaxID=877507 RepID=A0A7U3Q231_EPIFF|nr:hypothetical protein C2857_003902 [Epichloe festucae Fl1]
MCSLNWLPRPHRHLCLRYLKFVIRVPFWADGLKFSREEDAQDESTNDITIRIIMHSIWKLLNYLSCWNLGLIKMLQPEFQGVTLELAVQRFEVKNPPIYDKLARPASRPDWHRTYGQLRTEGRLRDNWHVCLITKLYLLQQSDLEIPPPAVFEICDRLPWLSDIRYEPSRLRGMLGDVETMRCGLAALTASRRSNLVRKMHILQLEKHPPTATRKRQQLTCWGTNPNIVFAPGLSLELEYRSLAAMFARASLTLEELFICNMIEAQTFLEHMLFLRVPLA